MNYLLYKFCSIADLLENNGKLELPDGHYVKNIFESKEDEEAGFHIFFAKYAEKPVAKKKVAAPGHMAVDSPVDDKIAGEMPF